MDWLLYSLLAPAVYAVVVFVDKYILEKQVSDYRGMPIYSSVVAGIFGVLIWIITGFPSLPLKDSLIVILTGILTIFGLAFYFKALSKDEASKITILFQITPILTLLLAFFILKSEISAMQLLGFFVILFSTISISFNKKIRAKDFFSNTFFLILLTDFLWALAFVLFKFVTEDNTFTQVIAYESFGMGIGGFILYYLFPSIKQAFEKTNRLVGSKILVFIVINEAVFLLSRFLTYLAISKGPVALVDVVAGTQVIFAIFYGIILTITIPKVFKEDISQKNLFQKLVATMLVLVGLYLIQLG